MESHGKKSRPQWWFFGDVFFAQQACGDSNSNWADVGNIDKQDKQKNMENSVVFLVLDLIV